MAGAGGCIAVVLKGYPRLSNTFVTQELVALERRGLELRVYALGLRDGHLTQPIDAELRAPVVDLARRLYREPGRALTAWRRARRLPGYGGARRAWLADLGRDPSPRRVLHFALARVLAAELPETATRLYAHFLDGPGSVARYAALISERPWCCSAHADIWAMAAWDKRDKLAEADWVVTCTAAGRDHLAALAAEKSKIELVYHGLDLARFPPPAPRPRRDGSDPCEPVVMLSVGRAVEKKGYDDLVDAVARLPRRLAWRFVHIGGGRLARRLRARAARLGVAERIAWLGPQPQPRVLEAYREADLFVLASRVAADGRRDGLPNVLLEAQSQGLACVSTTVSAIPELVIDGETGRLVPPGEPAALAAALEALIVSPETRRRMGTAGAARTRRHFAMDEGIDRLVARFGLDPVPRTGPDAEVAASP